MCRAKAFLAALLLLFPLAVAAAELSRIVATVNNDVVTSVQLDKAVAAQEAPATDETRRSVLDRLIEESLMQQRAEEIGLQVGEDEVEAAMRDVMQQNRLTRQQLEDALRLQGIKLDDYRASLRKQILRYKLVGRELQGRTEVSGREIRDFYEQHADEFREPATVELKRISFPVGPKTTSEERTALRRRADEALRQLRDGSPFDTVLAATVKEGGADGGEMGSVPLADLTPAFANAIKDLAVGASSDVIETDKGLHLLVVVGRTPGKTKPLEAVRETIRARLEEGKKATAAKAWMEELKQKAHIDIRL